MVTCETVLPFVKNFVQSKILRSSMQHFSAPQLTVMVRFSHLMVVRYLCYLTSGNYKQTNSL